MVFSEGAVMLAYSDRANSRPTRFYAALKAAQQPVEQLFDSTRAVPHTLLRYARHLSLQYERPGLAPSQEWYRTKDYVSSMKPAVTASSKAPAAGSGKSGGGGITSTLKNALASFCQPAPVAYRPNECLGGVPDRKYTYG
ncbi:MAG: hypothetical protein KGI37_10890 [Alphaproteobacteria bacterium]|nr:hypothetical protein [Alphaproteobacteria bacterium]